MALHRAAVAALNYLGQGALVPFVRMRSKTLFFLLFPEWAADPELRWPPCTVIASQP